LIVACVDYTTDVGDCLEAAVRHHPARPVVLLCPPGSNGLVNEAFGAGVDDIVALPTDPGAGVDPALSRQLAFALEKAVMRKRGTTETKADTVRNVICVLGLKGGSGKTLTSVNLAVSLAQSGHSVAILDLDLQFGDVALAMGLTPMRFWNQEESATSSKALALIASVLARKLQTSASGRKTRLSAPSHISGDT